MTSSSSTYRTVHVFLVLPSETLGGHVKVDPERGPLADPALKLDLSAYRFDKFLTDRQAKAGSLDASGLYTQMAVKAARLIAASGDVFHE